MIFVLFACVCFARFVETLLSLSCVLFGMFVLAIKALRFAQIIDSTVYETTDLLNDCYMICTDAVADNVTYSNRTV